MAKADYSGRTEQRKAALRRLADAKCLVNEGAPIDAAVYTLRDTRSNAS